MIFCLAGFAAEFSARGGVKNTALLYGVLDTQIQELSVHRKSIESKLPPADRRELELYQNLCRTKLGNAVFESLLEQGGKMTLDEAIELISKQLGGF